MSIESIHLATTTSLGELPGPEVAISTSATTAESQKMELACVDLICQLEALIAPTRLLLRTEQIENATDTARKMLAKLQSFAEKNLVGKRLDGTQNMIAKASDAILVHVEILRHRSWASALKSLFNTQSIDDSALLSHQKLGKALGRAFATAFYHAIATAGKESTSGEKIGQSTVVFVQEFEQLW